MLVVRDQDKTEIVLLSIMHKADIFNIREQSRSDVQKPKVIYDYNKKKCNGMERWTKMMQ